MNIADVKLIDVEDTIAEMVRDATNHSSCQNCAVENKLEAVHEYIAAIRAEAASPQVCEWTRPRNWSGMYDTGCGHLLDHEEAFKFCPYCGKAIAIKSEEGRG